MDRTLADMTRLAKLNPKVKTLDLRRSDLSTIEPTPPGTKRNRDGRFIADRRLRLWSSDPHCKRCAALVAFLPSEFQVDHIVELQDGGSDEDANCQILCTACHVVKTNEQKGQRS